MPVTEMLLAEDLFEQLLAGEKSVTMRNGHRDVRPGSFVFKCTQDESRSAKVDVIQVLHSRLADVPIGFLMEEGFDSTEQAEEALRRFYPHITKESEVTVIVFTFAA